LERMDDWNPNLNSSFECYAHVRVEILD
jgi:hypothetical protein